MFSCGILEIVLRSEDYWFYKRGNGVSGGFSNWVVRVVNSNNMISTQFP